MNGPKTLVAAALLGLPLVGCGDDTASPPTGRIDGQVVIEAEGISVALSSGATTRTGEARTTTDDNGQYAFPGLRAGTYSLEFSGFETTDFALVVVTGPVSLRVGESRVWDFRGS